MATLVHVTPDSTRADLAESMRHLNDRAKRTLRLTPQGSENPEWAAVHDNLNAMLTAWQERE